MEGLSDIPACDAFVRTECSVRPNFNPITRVGVFCLLRERSWETAVFVQLFPEFLLYLAISVSFLKATGVKIASVMGLDPLINKVGVITEGQFTFFQLDAPALARQPILKRDVFVPDRMPAFQLRPS